MIEGDSGDDMIYGDAYSAGWLTGVDTINGGLGNDRIYGGPSSDTIYGEVGDDMIYVRN